MLLVFFKIVENNLSLVILYILASSIIWLFLDISKSDYRKDRYFCFMVNHVVNELLIIFIAPTCREVAVCVKACASEVWA